MYIDNINEKIKERNKKIKNYLSNIGLILLIVIVLALPISILDYTNVINQNTYKIISVTIIVISTLIGSYKLGTKTKEKGYLEGLKLGIILVLLITIINIITNELNSKTIIYYLIILITSIIGSSIGINKKDKQKKVSSCWE